MRPVLTTSPRASRRTAQAKAGRRSVRPEVVRRRKLVVALLLTVSAATVLAGCAQAPANSVPSPSASYTPYTPAPPRAVDLRSATHALALQITARGVPVDGLDCRAGGNQQTSMRLHCTVITGGGAAHPDQIAEASWNKTAGTVHLTTIEPAPSTPQPPLATTPVAVADGDDLAAAQVTRAVRSALISAGTLTKATGLTCSDLHASLAGCEVHAEGKATRYFNVVLANSTLSIYLARG
jgi:hypothetical protein